MQMKVWILGLAVSIGALACDDAPPAAQAATETPAKTFGQPVPAGTATPVATIVTSPNDFVGKTILASGHVRKACTKKGCWMEVANSGDPKDAGCRVTFKDYGFFVPTDSAGRIARLEGVVALKQISKEDVAHLEAEGATFAKKNADGSATEVSIIATGVELTRVGG